MDLPILYEDAAVLVINKPPGVVVNRAESVKTETVQDWMALRFKSQITNPNIQKNISQDHWSLSFGHCDFCSRAGIVHRIDKETSGILLIAKTPEAFVELQRQFKERLINKTYIAIVHGKLVPEQGEIRAPVGRLPWNKERFGIVPGGKDSVTRYKVISDQPTAISHQQAERGKLKAESFSLVELHPETGRTHQIRVHLKYINHPILGDYLYAGRKTSRADRAGNAPRVMLHAWKIVFQHPETGKPLAVEAPIPDDMNNIMKT